MCGIVGIARKGTDGWLGVDSVRAMADAIVHRGPDAAGLYDGGEAILGMRRLAIIDLETGDQPISNEDRSIWVVCNGEIYNFASLRHQLAAAGHTFATQSDTEVLVHLYEEYGDDFLKHVEGMFALALWDGRRRKLVLARDRLGIKPLYYWQDGSRLAFSSEIKSLLKLPGFSTAIDDRSLSDYLRNGFCVSPRTIFSGVKKLPPACSLTWQDGEISIRQYWSVPDVVDESLSYDDWVVAIREELMRAVEDQMVSDVPIGAFLSGGIDSSSIAAIMAQHSNGRLNTYSIGYSGGRIANYYNELPFAKMVSEQIGSRHTEIEVQPEISRLLPQLMWHLEEPISDSAVITTFLVAKLAAPSVKVILSGVGGDELFAGYNRYLGEHYRKRYQKLPNWCRQHLFPHIASILPSGRQNRAMDLARYARRFVESDGLDWRGRYLSYMEIGNDQNIGSLLAHQGQLPASGLSELIACETAEDNLLRLLRIDWKAQLAENLLLLTDKMTMARSLECRVPFLDQRLVELAATIPARHKLPNGNLKALLKDAVRDLLPETITTRRKRGFGAPVGSWFKHELAPLRATLLDRTSVERRGLVDAAFVQHICADHDKNREDYSDLILVLMNLEIWARIFLDGRPHEDVADELSERSRAA